MAKPRRRPAHPPDIIRQIAARIPEKKAPAAPMMPVAFVETPAQNAGTVVEIITSDRGTRSKRRYRLHILERMGRMRLLSRRQVTAGLAVHDAWCRTQLSPPAVRELFVDTTPRPDDIAVAQVEAMQAYADIMALVPVWYRQAVRRLAVDRLLPTTARELEDARRGLSALARKKSY